MKKIALMDTSIMSFNLGDQIIMESARKNLNNILKDAFVVNMPTHSPLFHWYEFSLRKEDSFRKSLNMIDLKLVCGTNLLSKNMFNRKNSWNVNLIDSKYFNDFILVGVGTDGLPKIKNNYTKNLYKNLLSNQFIHSTRDEKTKITLESMGFRAINTGCVTLWGLTKEHCLKITEKKSDSVIFTLTDYKPNKIADEEFLEILSKNYKKIYFWPQGIMDLEYFESLDKECLEGKLEIIQSSLEGFDYYLRNIECDYVGTRLHAGIKAMQLFRRSIILGVDNRARDMKDTYNLNYVDRLDYEGLKNMINSEFKTEINLNEEKIEEFLAQFSNANEVN